MFDKRLAPVKSRLKYTVKQTVSEQAEDVKNRFSSIKENIVVKQGTEQKTDS